MSSPNIVKANHHWSKHTAQGLGISHQLVRCCLWIFFSNLPFIIKKMSSRWRRHSEVTENLTYQAEKKIIKVPCRLSPCKFRPTRPVLYILQYRGDTKTFSQSSLFLVTEGVSSHVYIYGIYIHWERQKDKQADRRAGRDSGLWYYLPMRATYFFKPATK